MGKFKHFYFHSQALTSCLTVTENPSRFPQLSENSFQEWSVVRLLVHSYFGQTKNINLFMAFFHTDSYSPKKWDNWCLMKQASKQKPPTNIPEITSMSFCSDLRKIWFWLFQWEQIISALFYLLESVQTKLDDWCSWVLDGGAVALATIGSEIRTFWTASGMWFYLDDNRSEHFNG